MTTQRSVMNCLLGGLALTLCCSCHHHHNEPVPDTAPQISNFTIAPAAPSIVLEGGGSATALVEWSGTVALYTVEFHFGGAAPDPGLVNNANSPLSAALTLADVAAA